VVIAAESQDVFVPFQMVGCLQLLRVKSAHARRQACSTGECNRADAESLSIELV
jgi:hypothetical protein